VRPWSGTELARLTGLRLLGHSWEEIAAELPGRTPAACQTASVRRDLPCREPPKRPAPDAEVDAVAREFERDPGLTDAAVAARLGLTHNRVLWIRYRRLKLPGVWDRLRGL
jgi:hypothetical protein